MAKRGRPRIEVPEHLQPQMEQLFEITKQIKEHQAAVLDLSKTRTSLILLMREAGASTGSIAEACGLNRRSYPIRHKKGNNA